MDRVFEDDEKLARSGIHLLGGRYDEVDGQWIELEVVTVDPAEAERHLRERYSTLIRIDHLGESLTEDVPTPWESWSVDAAERLVKVRFATSGYVSARAEVTETSDLVKVTVIETRTVGAYGPVLAYKVVAVELQAPLEGRPITDGAGEGNGPL